MLRHDVDDAEHNHEQAPAAEHNMTHLYGVVVVADVVLDLVRQHRLVFDAQLSGGELVAGDLIPAGQPRRDLLARHQRRQARLVVHQVVRDAEQKLQAKGWNLSNLSNK